MTAPTMPLYQVQLEVGGILMCYEVATKNHDAVDVALHHLRSQVPSGAVIHVGGYSEIGQYPAGDPVVVTTTSR